jgi:hypothetical protein
LRRETVSAADRPSPWSSRSAASASTPVGNREPTAATEEHLGEGDDVDAEIEERAAAQFEREEPISRVELPRDPQVGLHRAHLPDGTVGDQLPHRDDGRLEPGPHRLHDEDAGRAGERDHLRRAGRRGGERLLHQQRLAGPERSQREGVVLGMRCRDVEDVDLGVGEDLGVGPVRPLDAVAGREGSRAVGGSGGHGRHPGALDQGEVADHRLGDAPRSHDAPANVLDHRPNASRDGRLLPVAVLIDSPVWPWRGRRWSHLVSDVSYDELHAFVAVELGIPRRAFQGDHYDIPEDLYDVAVAAGATPVGARELLGRLMAAGLRLRKPRPGA